MAEKRTGNIRLTGVPELRKALQRAEPLAMEALASAMFLEQEAVMAKAKERTPVDTGVLRASGTVLRPEVEGPRVEVVAGFGGAAQGYAATVHEKLGVHHPVGQAKYLESAFLERAPHMASVMAARIRRAWERLQIK